MYTEYSIWTINILFALDNLLSSSRPVTYKILFCNYKKYTRTLHKLIR